MRVVAFNDEIPKVMEELSLQSLCSTYLLPVIFLVGICLKMLKCLGLKCLGYAPHVVFPFLIMASVGLQYEKHKQHSCDLKLEELEQQL